MPESRFRPPAGPGPKAVRSGARTGGGAEPSVLRRAGGVLAGTGTALVGLLCFLLAGLALGPFLLWPRSREAALRSLAGAVRGPVTLELRRRALFFGERFPRHHGGRRAIAYLAARTGTGLLTAVVAVLLAFGAVLASLLLVGLVRGTLGWSELPAQVLIGGVLLFLAVQGLISLAALDDRLARRYFGPSEHELLRRRIDELAASRAGILEAVDAERRRIERDMHDGVQQRLVALAMLLGRARRNRVPERREALLEQAHKESQDVLNELREVAWRVYPSSLDSLGLEEALAGVAERCAIPVRTEVRLASELPGPVRTAAYFVVSESVNNAAKHSGADHIDVVVGQDGSMLYARIRDNGAGGADPGGTGLSGLRRRVAALDGRLGVSSPAGGPTTVTAEIPCA